MYFSVFKKKKLHVDNCNSTKFLKITRIVFRISIFRTIRYILYILLLGELSNKLFLSIIVVIFCGKSMRFLRIPHTFFLLKYQKIFNFDYFFNFFAIYQKVILTTKKKKRTKTSL